MALMLGYDGKKEALEHATGLAVTPYTSLYIGLLRAAPANLDGMTLSTLISAGQGNEFSINANFYTGRKAVTFVQNPVTHDGASASNGSVINWTNTSGSPITIPALFITDVASGGSGRVPWVGIPDVGSSYVINGQIAEISIGGLIVRID